MTGKRARAFFSSPPQIRAASARTRHGQMGELEGAEARSEAVERCGVRCARFGRKRASRASGDHSCTSHRLVFNRVHLIASS